MKKIIYSFFALAVLFTTAGCAGMLDTKSPDQLTEDKFYRNESEALMALATIYAPLDGPGSWSYAEVKFPVEEYRTDLVEMGTDAPGYIDWAQLFFFTNADGNTQTSSYWENAYVGILRANQVMDGVKKVPVGSIDEGVRKVITAEARFLRAYYHLRLQMNWRQIIVRDFTPTAGSLSKPLSTRSDSWDFIINELEESANDLLDAQPAANAGRATKSAAYAYKGFALVNRAYETATGDFVTSPDQSMLQDAIVALNKVNASLNPNFIALFDGTEENSSEAIFERQFSASTDAGFWVVTRHHQWLRTAPLGGWDEIRPSQRAYDVLTKEKNATGGYDKRAYGTILFSCDYYNDPATFPYAKGTNDTFDKTFAKEDRTPIASFRKYLPSTRAELDMDILGTNVPLMRHANVLLLKAEAMAQTGDAAGAFTIINDIRATHGGMPATTETDVMKAIEHERIMEFTLENSRFFDLRRWGKLSQLDIVDADGKVVRKFTNNNLYFPIPKTEMDTNDAL